MLCLETFGHLPSALLAAQNADDQRLPFTAVWHIHGTSERKAMAKLTIPEIQRLAREVFIAQ